jgi:hypothetical protein
VKNVFRIFAVIIVVGMVAYLSLHSEMQGQKQREQEAWQRCNDLVALLTTMYPDTPYEKMPLNRQLQLRDTCGVPIH